MGYLDKYLGQWTPLVFLNLTPERVQNPDEFVKYLEEVCCHLDNSRKTQISAMFWGLARAYCATLFYTIQHTQGKEGDNK